MFVRATLDRHGHLLDERSGDVVPWWSFTKTLIAVAAVGLAEDGRVSLDDPLPGRVYTLRQLLRHRAGVGDYGGLSAYHDAVAGGRPPWSDDELFARVAPDRLLFPPDGGWAYSNVGYLLARRALEAACDAGLGQILRERVFDPLGLHGVRLAETSGDMATTSFAGGRTLDPGWVFHGVVIGPAVEAARVLHALALGDLPSPAARAALLDRHPLPGETAGPPWSAPGYGTGLMIGDMRCPGQERTLSVFGHSAGGPGSVGAVYYAPEADGRTVAVFAEGADGAAAERAALRALVGSGPID